MTRKRSDSGWRAMALAAALFAITLNFLQPVAHAVLLRDGGPIAVGTAFCLAAAADLGNKPGSLPANDVQHHECCLGLAHTAALVRPAANCLAVVFADSVAVPLLAAESIRFVGNRDGRHQPRGPPSLV